MVWYTRLIAAAGVLSLVTLVPAPVEAQRPGAQLGRFEVPGFDFAPDGAWRKRARDVRQARQAALQSGAFRSLNAPGASQYRMAGNYNLPVVLINYSNVTNAFTASSYLDVLFNPVPTLGPYSVKTYYEQLSRNSITMNGVVFDAVVTDNVDSYYEDGCRGIGVGPQGQPVSCAHPGLNGTSARFGELLVEVLTKLDDGSIDWGQFDNDGIDGLPNSGDDDGFVDFVNFIQPEVDGACGTTNLWAHRFVMNGVSASNFTTQTSWTGHGGQFIRIRDYTIQSGHGGANACSGGQIMPIGTIAHETGHAFGLPDLYDTQGSSQGIGEWGLMGSGNYSLPYSPAAYEAWSLVEMGWVAVDTLSTSGTVTINPIQVSDTVFYIPLTGTDEYLLLENRDSLLSDTAQMNSAFGSRKKSPGLLIWHIDQSEVNAGGAINTGPVHGVALEQADGLNQLRATSGGNRGDAGDSYPGSTVNRNWTTTSDPASVNNAGTYAGFIIDSIYRNASGVPGVPSPIVLRFYSRRPSVFTTNRPGATIKVNSVTFTRFDSFVDEGLNVDLEAITPQTISAGRTQLTFTTWSDANINAIRTIVSGAVPDTLVASFSANHKLNLVTPPTGGTITSDIAGSPNLVTGAFVAEGTPVTLTATPNSGSEFVRFLGDTVTTNSTLVLPMGRPYSLTPVFTGTVAIVTADAVAALLGVACGSNPCLSSQQLTYMDQIGNNDGSYNLGDFLSYADRTGLNPSSEAMRQVLSQPTVSVPLGAPTTPKEH